MALLRILSVLFGSALLAAATFSVVEYARAWPLFMEAERLERGGRYRRTPDVEAIRDRQLPKPAWLCNVRIERALATIRLATVDALVDENNFAQFDTATAAAIRQMERVTQCAPHDGNAWLRLAMLLVQTEGPSGRVIEAARTSWRHARADIEVLLARVPFGLRLLAAGIEDLRPEVENDLDILFRNAYNAEILSVFIQTAEVARGPLETRIRQFPIDRYRTFWLALDNSGTPFNRRALPRRSLFEDR